MLMQAYTPSMEIVNQQTVQISADLFNSGAVPIKQAILGWSKNGISQTPVPITLTPELASLEQRKNVFITNFQADNTDTVKLIVWINTINGEADSIKWNDTVSTMAVKVPLVEFVAPFIEDTIIELSFKINAVIRTVTGAPQTTPPVLHWTTNIKETYILEDSIVMVLLNGIWQATIPQQYYNSKIVYSLTVSDAVGNTETAMDSTYINFEDFGITNPTLDVGNGTDATYYNPYYTTYNYGHSRNFYMDYEINPQKMGGFIRSIAFYNTSTSASTCDNISFYLKAVSDSVVRTSSYVDPVADGATLVWGPATSIAQQGWNIFTLHAPFYLPPGKNLLVYCNNRDGSYSNNGTAPYWQSTTTTRNSSYQVWDNATWPPTTNAVLGQNRPDIRLDIYGSSPYPGNNLGLFTFLSPVNKMDNSCDENYSPVSVVMRNLGENDYDLAKDTVLLRLELTDPRGTQYSESIRLNTGIFKSKMTDTVILIPSLPTMYAGQYNMKAWIESSIDGIVYDDTIVYSYASGKIGLPIDEDFTDTVLSSKLVSVPLSGLDTWTRYSDPTSSVQPDFGTGVLRYVGAKGDMAQITTRPLDLNGSLNPKLVFWYYHDSTASEQDNSYTDVNIIIDGATNTLLTMLRRGTPNGWRQYTIDLDPYKSQQCVLIQFKSMNKFGLQSFQYIDRILITSEQDLAISEILITPEASVCDLANKELKVVLRTTTNQAIDFSVYPTDLVVEVPGYPQPFTYSMQGVMTGNFTTTVPFPAHIDLSFGVDTVKAYLSPAIDSYNSNDRAILVLDNRPDLSITVNPLSDVNSCFKTGAKVYQEVVIRNTGNMALSGIKLWLRLIGDNSTETIQDSKTVDLAAGETVLHTFTESYIVPEDANYRIQVIAYLGCDSALLNDNNATDECADRHNLSIESVDNPPSTQTGVSGSSETITVSLKNIDDHYSFDNVTIVALIENEQGQTLFSRLGTVPTIGFSSTVPFTFPESYVIPNDSVYYITVYLNRVDNYPEDDTLRVSRRAIYIDNIATGEGNVFTLGQNIPNPANNSTRIDYSIPESSEVVFHVHSISGQLLYSKTIEAQRGAQSIELNTAVLSAGVYYYSIEYKGQRIVKRMSVR
jgi:hypothetical protein